MQCLQSTPRGCQIVVTWTIRGVVKLNRVLTRNNNVVKSANPCVWVMEILDLFLELLIVRIPLIDTSKDLPQVGLKREGWGVVC